MYYFKFEEYYEVIISGKKEKKGLLTIQNNSHSKSWVMFLGMFRAISIVDWSMFENISVQIT